jgi:hypothetical protein
MLWHGLLAEETASLLLAPIRAAMTGPNQARHGWLYDPCANRPDPGQTPADHT